MTIIADAGGTKTDWRIILDNNSIKQFTTGGFNANHHQIETFLTQNMDQLKPYLSAREFYFYIAGLMPEDTRKEYIIKYLQNIFSNAKIEIENDTLAVARGLCLHQEGWVGILGTGSNLAYYDGEKIKTLISPLGYILGDEGSGAFMGKKLLTDFLRNNLPVEIKGVFENRFHLSQQDIIKETYQGENPKKFLASFTKFIFQHIQNPYCFQLVYDCFLTYYKVFILPHHIESPIHFSGSIAFYFSSILKNVMVEQKISIGKIVESPIAGLTLYHQKNKL